MSDYPDFPSFIDSTTRKNWVTCEMATFYSNFMHLKSVGKSIHLHFGGCLAKGLEEFRIEFYGGNKDFEKAYGKGITALLKMWRDYEHVTKDKKTLENCLICFDDYFIQYPPDNDIVQPLIVDGNPAVEFSFALPIPETKHPQTGDPILYAGRFDMLGVYNKSMYIVDEKSATSLGEWWANQFKLASQPTGYCWAGKQFGYPIQGAIIRGIAPLTNTVNHSQLILQRPQWMIDRWLAQLIRNVKRMIEAWEERVFDYNLDTSCGNYGGCSYLDLCTSRQPEKWMGEYEVKPWDPLKSTDD